MSQMFKCPDPESDPQQERKLESQVVAEGRRNLPTDNSEGQP